MNQYQHKLGSKSAQPTLLLLNITVGQAGYNVSSVAWTLSRIVAMLQVGLACQYDFIVLFKSLYEIYFTWMAPKAARNALLFDDRPVLKGLFCYDFFIHQ